MSEEKFIDHKYIKPHSIEARLYQQTIFATSLSGNTLVVLPTGLGKTIILALLIAKRMEQYPKSFILIIAPTKPLVEQHLNTFRKVINIIEDEIVMLSGAESPEKREEIWKQAQIIIATPQVVENDLLSGKLSLKNCSLLGVDEAHRAVGDYAYVYVTKQYLKNASFPLVLGITASPGSSQEKIEEVCKNLSIKHIETRLESSFDVKPYIQKTELEWIYIDLPEKFLRIKTLLEHSLSLKLHELKRLGWIESASITIQRRDLLKLPPLITKQFDTNENLPNLYLALGLVGSAVRLTHAIELLETQGISSFIYYFNKMQKEVKGRKASRNLINLMNEDALIVANDIANQLVQEGIEHPKIFQLQKIVKENLIESPNSKILVFTQYRNSAMMLAELLNKIENVKASRFVGQASKTDDKGFSQKKQLEIMQQFRDGVFNLLVATSVGEEGLDVSECDLVIFYDCVPSAIRSIQRRGRTGRKRAGKVIVLITKGTRDEGYFWASRSKEKQMKQNIRELENVQKQKIDLQQRSIEDFFAAGLEKNKEVSEDIVDEFDEELTILSDNTPNDLESKSEETSYKDTEEIPLEEKKQLNDFFNNENQPGETKKVRIIVDSREAKSGIAKELSELDVNIDLKQLSIGDFILSKDIAVERKDVADFSQSIIDGRLFPQTMALKRNYLHPIFIIEGESLYGHKAINPDAIRGAVLSILVNLDIKIIWSRNIKDTAKYLKSLAQREQIKTDNAPVIRFDKAPSETSEILEYIVAGFPNINTVLAKRILDKFDTLENFFKASIDELQEIKGIGKKTASEIKELILTKYNPKT